MSRRLLLLILAGVAIAVVAAVYVVPSLGTTSDSQPQPGSSPQTPPQWVLDEARKMSDFYGHAEYGYWGLLHDPELGDLTGSGPDDPSTKAYAIVLIGDFPRALTVMRMRASASPPPTPHYVVSIYTATDTPKAAGVWGCGPSFDASRYPNLHRFELQ